MPSFKLSNFKVNKTSLKNGQTLKISFKVKGKNLDPSNGAIFFSNGSGSTGGVFDYNAKKGELVYTRTINNSYKPGKYKLESIRLDDKTGNSVTYYNSKYYKKSGKHNKQIIRLWMK